MTSEELQNIVLQAIELGQTGKTKACNKELRKIYATLKTNPLILWESSHVSHLGKTLLLILHLDLIDDEEKSIGLVLLAYLFLTKGIRNEEQVSETDLDEIFRIRKDRILLLRSFDDFFVDSLQEIYYANDKAPNREAHNEQRKAVLSRVPFMQFSDIYDIEQDYPNLRDDEYLLDTANYIELEDEINSENIKEAKLLHEVLFKTSFQKLKEGKLIY